jgi:hypothetical protein
MYGTYLRLDVTVHNGWRSVVRAAAKKLTTLARRDPARREARHRFHGAMLAHHQEAKRLVRTWRL